MSETFQFLRPAWLLGLPLFLALVWWQARARARGGVWSRVCDAALLPFVVRESGASGSRAINLGIAVLGSLTLLALAGPVWDREEVPVFRGESALVIALDLSRSMNAEDLTPSRLTRAKYKIADLLKLRTSGQTGLLVFAAQSFVVTPLTDDTTTLLAHLQGLDTSIMPSQGSEPASALTLAGELLSQAGAVGGHVLLVTDSADPQALERAQDVLEQAGFSLSVLGVGTGEGAPIPDSAGGFAKDAAGDIIMSRLDGDALRDLAARGRGIYIEVSPDERDVRSLEDFLQANLNEQSERLEDLAASQWREVGPWLLLPLLPLAAWGFRRGLLVGLALAILPLAPPEAAADWWRTNDQAAAHAFEHGEYAAAAEKFSDPTWRGAARYREGDFDDAVAAFADRDDAAAHYNRGNALARLGRYDEALAAYEKALELAPEDDDVVHNKTLIEDLLKQQQPPPEQGQDDQQSDQKQDPQDAESGENQGSGGDQADDSQQQQTQGDASGESQDDGGEPSDADNQSQAEQAAAEEEQGRQESEQTSEEAQQEAAAKQSAEAANESDSERAQATEQWLRQIPDDPAGLLRRKFQYQYKQQYGNAPYEGDRW